MRTSDPTSNSALFNPFVFPKAQYLLSSRLDSRGCIKVPCVVDGDQIVPTVRSGRKPALQPPCPDFVPPLVFCQFPGCDGNFFGVRQKPLLETGRVGHRGIEPRDARDGPVQIPKSALTYDGGDFSSDAAGTRIFVNNQQYICLLYGSQNSLPVQR